MKIKNKKTPKWVKTLPPGIYDTKDLVKHSKLTGRNSLIKVMINHGAKIKKVKVAEHNLIKNVYYWEGYKEPEDKKPELKYFIREDKE